ncbi:hypothetical protein E2C01_063941 [Portunus trituberculatus]|uniref:Uncharacterized protein n=1 Tax=Portunus trituberculatus TaxID=210409 RepID=A0A5B7HBU1_PORTR|nr:hypothetical protein [Portunus trituberculatus]
MFLYERQVDGSTPLGGQAAVSRHAALQGRRGVFGRGCVISVSLLLRGRESLLILGGLHEGVLFACCCKLVPFAHQLEIAQSHLIPAALLPAWWIPASGFLWLRGLVTLEVF